MRCSRVFAFGVVAAVTLVAAACSLQDGGSVLSAGADGSLAADAAGFDGTSPSSDGAAPPADGSTPDSGDAAVVVDAGTDSAVPVTFSCGGTQVTSCATDCPAAPIDCPSGKNCVAACFGAGGCAGSAFQCDACGTNGSVALSRCEPQSPTAFAECLSGLNRCGCSNGNASSCPGNNQTCENKQCFECGEPDGGNQINHFCEKGGGARCESGGACN